MSSRTARSLRWLVTAAVVASTIGAARGPRPVPIQLGWNPRQLAKHRSRPLGHHHVRLGGFDEHGDAGR